MWPSLFFYHSGIAPDSSIKKNNLSPKTLYFTQFFSSHPNFIDN
jgi:hypothetical protein